MRTFCAPQIHSVQLFPPLKVDSAAFLVFSGCFTFSRRVQCIVEVVHSIYLTILTIDLFQFPLIRVLLPTVGQFLEQDFDSERF